MKKVAKIFLILTIVGSIAAMVMQVINFALSGFISNILFALCAGVGLAVSLVALSQMKTRKPSQGISICVLIFGGFLAGIFLLCSKPEEYGEAPSVKSDTLDGESHTQTNNTVKVNEPMSAKAQYAFNKKIKEAVEAGIDVDETIEAKLFAQAIELQVLKAPASAVFCDLEEMTVVQTNGGIIVSGYVDSQNSYGAMVRETFTYTVIKQDDVWKDVDKFVSTDTVIKKKLFSSWIGWFILFLIVDAVGALIWFLTNY